MERVSKLGGWFNPIGILTTLIVIIATHVADRQMLISDHAIIERFEAHGTPSVVNLKATYDEHFRAADARLDKLEQGLSALPRIETKLDVLAAGQAVLKESLDEHKRTVNPQFRSGP